jgi:hypothetical protein
MTVQEGPPPIADTAETLRRLRALEEALDALDGTDLRHPTVQSVLRRLAANRHLMRVLLAARLAHSHHHTRHRLETR